MSLIKLYDPDLFVAFEDANRKQDGELVAAVRDRLRPTFLNREITIQDGFSFERLDDTAHALRMVPEEIARGAQSACLLSTLKASLRSLSTSQYLAAFSRAGEDVCAKRISRTTGLRLSTILGKAHRPQSFLARRPHPPLADRKTEAFMRIMEGLDIDPCLIESRQA
jgi:hypothetical protein